MFHPRTAVFEQPITYHIPPSKSTSSAAPKPDQPDFSQYYISELFRSYFPLPFCFRAHCSLDFLCLALESRTTILKSAKGPISVAECDTQGRFIIIENTSRSKSIALAGWTLRQQSDQGDLLTFTFPENCLLRPNHSLKVKLRVDIDRHLCCRSKVFTKSNESERRNVDLVASSLSSWYTGTNVVTTLINAEGKVRDPAISFRGR